MRKGASWEVAARGMLFVQLLHTAPSFALPTFTPLNTHLASCHCCLAIVSAGKETVKKKKVTPMGNVTTYEISKLKGDVACGYLWGTAVSAAMSGQFPETATALITHASDALATPEMRQEIGFDTVMAGTTT